MKNLLKTALRSRSNGEGALPQSKAKALFDSIPDDVLEEIFYSLIQEQSRTSTANWTLSHVNRRWRAVSISSPRIWCNIGAIYVNDSITREREEALLNRLRVQLARCKGHPISFKFDAGLSTFTEILAVTTDILLLLASYSSQWHDVCLSIHGGVYSALESIRSNLPLLCHLSLRIDIAEMWDPPLHWDHFALAPELRSVKLDLHQSWRNPSIGSTIALPWIQLTRFDEDVDVGLLPVLLEAHELSHLTCGVSSSLSTSLQSYGILRKDRLSTMHIKFRSWTTSMLCHLDLPSLTHLSIIAFKPTPTIFSDIHQLLKNSNCHLEVLHLIISALVSGDDSALGLLNACPDLILLSLNHIPATLKHWLGDTTTAPFRPYLPNLQSLIIYHNHLHEDPSPNWAVLAQTASYRDSMYEAGITPKLDVTFEARLLHPWVVRAILCDFEAFPQIPHDDIRMLERWKLALRTEATATSRSRWKLLAPWYHMQRREMKEVLNEMENYNLVESKVTNLYRMDILYLLHRVANQVTPLILGSDLSTHSKRALAILEAWRPTFSRHAAANRHWRCRRGQCLKYMHRDSDERNDEENMWDVVVGPAGYSSGWL